MTCRVARLFQDAPCIDLVCCCECGSSDVEVCRALNNLGPHLCQTCTQSLVEYGTWERPRPPEKAAYLDICIERAQALRRHSL